MITTPMRQISLIVAVASNQAIGNNNRMPWHIPEDFKWFKRHTTGHPVVMGRLTWESLPLKPLPGRKNIVISAAGQVEFAGASWVRSIEEAILEMDPAGENFVIGGERIYRQFLPLASKIYLTRIVQEFNADAFFPEIDPQEWAEVFREEHPEAKPSYLFLILERTL